MVVGLLLVGKGEHGLLVHDVSEKQQGRRFFVEVLLGTTTYHQNSTDLACWTSSSLFPVPGIACQPLLFTPWAATKLAEDFFCPTTFVKVCSLADFRGDFRPKSMPLPLQPGRLLGIRVAVEWCLLNGGGKGGGGPSSCWKRRGLFMMCCQ